MYKIMYGTKIVCSTNKKQKKKKKKRKGGGGKYNSLLTHFICRVSMIVTMFTWVWDHGYRYDYNAMGVGTGMSLACQEVTGTDPRQGPWVQVQAFVSG